MELAQKLKTIMEDHAEWMKPVVAMEQPNR